MAYVAWLILPVIMDHTCAQRALVPERFQAWKFEHTVGEEMPPERIEHFKVLMGSCP